MRRLRENTSLETDISKTGDVVVEGHAIGRLDGFVFTPAASAAGSEARTLAGAAQKALAGEIDARATRLAKASDEQFVLASDGAIRWLGQAVGKLVAAEEVLKPRVRIIADEHLTGAPRDAVQARLDLWLKTHIEKVLAPLFQLAAAEDVTGMARGIAFQLIEALGVLERQRVAEDVKGLDQPARAGLRKYGVRFGAYHLYVPALLKPTPRALATQLYALKHSAVDTKGLDAVEQLAKSGRTSIAADKEVDRALYRIAGYRVCGERAVRADILERLADIIRPALAWRPGGPGVKPPGALDGSGFTVVPGMTSLAGCAGEDFASILRALGYRMELRPKPVESPSAGVTAETSPAIAPGAEVAEASTEPAEEATAAAAETLASSETEAVIEAAAAPDLIPAIEPDAVAPEAERDANGYAIRIRGAFGGFDGHLLAAGGVAAAAGGVAGGRRGLHAGRGRHGGRTVRDGANCGSRHTDRIAAGAAGNDRSLAAGPSGGTAPSAPPAAVSAAGPPPRTRWCGRARRPGR